MKIKRVFLTTSINTSVLQFMTRDLAHAFRRLGLDVHVEQEAYPGQRYDPFRIMRQVYHFRPQLVVRMDHVRAEDGVDIWGKDPNSGGWDGKHVHAAWIQDALDCHFHLDADGKPVGRHLVQGFGPRDVIFTSFPGLNRRFVSELGFPQERVRHLPVGANFDLFYPEPMPTEGEFIVGFPCSVGDAATARDPRRSRRRTDPVRWLLEAGVKVRLWGRGWEQNDLFKPHWQGVVQNGADLREAYGSCHAVLHANSDLTLGHQRVYEAQACERPVLVYAREEDRKEVEESDMPGIFPFWTKEELPAQINAIRKWKPDQARQKAFREGNDYPIRCRQILDLCENLL